MSNLPFWLEVCIVAKNIKLIYKFDFYTYKLIYYVD